MRGGRCPARAARPRAAGHAQCCLPTRAQCTGPLSVAAQAGLEKAPLLARPKSDAPPICLAKGWGRPGRPCPAPRWKTAGRCGPSAIFSRSLHQPLSLSAPLITLSPYTPTARARAATIMAKERMVGGERGREMEEEAEEDEGMRPVASNPLRLAAPTLRRSFFPPLGRQNRHYLIHTRGGGARAHGPSSLFQSLLSPPVPAKHPSQKKKNQTLIPHQLHLPIHPSSSLFLPNIRSSRRKG